MSEEFINAGRQPFSGKSSDLDLPAGQELLFLTGSSTTYVGCVACFPPVIARASEDCQEGTQWGEISGFQVFPTMYNVIISY